MERCIFISVIAALSILQLTAATFRPYYFNKNLDSVSLILKTMKTSYFVSGALKTFISFSYKEYFVIQSIITPIMFGLIYLLKKNTRERIFDSYLRDGGEKHKNSHFQ